MLKQNCKKYSKQVSSEMKYACQHLLELSPRVYFLIKMTLYIVGQTIGLTKQPSKKNQYYK